MNRIKFCVTILFLVVCVSSVSSKKIEPLVRIPFVTNGFQTFIELKINGSKESLWFGFDTGCGTTVLDSNFLKKSNIVLKGQKEQLTTSTNVVEVDVSTNNQIEFGSFNLENIKFYIEDLRHISPTPAGNKVAGVIGYDLMKDYVTYINHDQSYIELYKKGTELIKTTPIIPIYLYEGQLPVVEGSVTTSGNKKKPFKFVFDSGASFTVGLGPNYINTYNLYDELKVKIQIPVIGGAASSQSINYLSSLSRISFGSFEFDNVPVNFSTSNSGALATDSVDGVIGFDLIRRFNVVLDYENMYIKLLPNKNYKKPLNFNLTGLVFKKKGDKIFISTVLEHSPAKMAGIQVGDVLLSIDKKVFASASQVRNYLKGSYKIKNIVLERNGEISTVRLKPAVFY